MRWDGQRESDNVEDGRGQGGGGLRIGGRGIGLGTVAIALVGGWLLGVNPLTLLSMLSGGGGGQMDSGAPSQSAPHSQPGAKPEDRTAKFVSVVLASTEDTWTEIFRQTGRTYQAPRLHLFSGRTPTACGAGEASAGPFYCPGDQKVYIDLGFFRLLEERFKAPGDFAQAYVIAHEVGHHVQNQIGIMDKVQAARGRMSERQSNTLSVRLELQADCFAGVWAHHSDKAKGWLEQGDVDEALRAATAIGDDTLQRQSQGTVVPDSFTHGSSAQRKYWFQAGFTQGTLTGCDTFKQATP